MTPDASQWLEKIATFSIHPDAASRDDVARMAAEYMELRAAANSASTGRGWRTSWPD